MTRRHLGAAALAALLLGAAASACGSSSDEPGSVGAGGDPSSLVGRSFEATSVTVDGVERPPVKGTTITIDVRQDTIGAYAGCNHMGADLTIEADRLVLGDEMESTLIGCDPDLLAQDTWLGELLRTDPSWTSSGSTLTLTSGGTTVVLADSTERNPAPGLVHNTWTLDSIVEGATASSSPSPVTATLDFDSDGTVVGRGTCNGYRGTYEAWADRIIFEPGPATEIGCPPAEAIVEDAVRSTLDGLTYYGIEDQELTIISTDGNLRLVYRLGR